jgi:hypothetical protein
MENFVAGIFSTREPALEAYAALTQLGTLQMQSAGVYARNLEGDLTLESEGFGTAGDLAFADSGAGQEALDELDADTPDGAHVLLLHIDEADPTSVDEIVLSHGGAVVRRSIGELESSVARRFADL